MLNYDYNEYNKWKRLLQDFHQNRLSAEWMDSWQNEQLKSVLKNAASHSPFYKRLLGDIDIDSVSARNLHALPFTTKKDLTEQRADIISGPLKTPGIFYETTGTTGKPTPAPRRTMELVRGIASVTEALRRVMPDLIDADYKSVAIMGPSELHATGDVYGSSFMDLGFMVFKVWPFSVKVKMDRLIDILKEYQIEVMMGPWGVLEKLYRVLRSKDIDVKRELNVKYIMVIGEICTKEAERNLSNVWGAKIINFMYASQESSISAMCTEEGNLHLLPYSYIFENIEIGGSNPVPNGTVGELVLTMIQPDCLKPLIRYRTGDTCIIAENNRDRLKSPVIEMLGRISDYLSLGGRMYSPTEIEKSILSHLDHCIGYTLSIRKRNDYDLLVIELELAAGKEDEGIQKIKNYWRDLGVKCAITVNEVAYDPNSVIQSFTELTGMVSWKTARILDLRTNGNVSSRFAELKI